MLSKNSLTMSLAVVLFACFSLVPSTFAKQKWYDFYKEGCKLMEEAKWDLAIEQFNKAISMQPDEGAKARTYGMRFVKCYPHREMGIAYYELGEFYEAEKELRISLSQIHTERAEEYLAKVQAWKARSFPQVGETKTPYIGEEPLAERHFVRIAERNEKAKKNVRVTTIVSVTCLSAGILFLALPDQSESGLYPPKQYAASGLWLLSAGLIYGTDAILTNNLIKLSRTELESVQLINDVEQREEASEVALTSLAKRARSSRLTKVALSSVGSLIFFAGRPFHSYDPHVTLSEIRWKEEDSVVNDIFGAGWACFAVYHLLAKTREEKALRDYLEAKERTQRLGLSIGIGKYGDGRLTLVCSF